MAESRLLSLDPEAAAPAPHSVHPGRESIDDSVRILKHGETFAVFDRHGDARPAGRSSLGLYHDGARHLSMLVLELAGERPLLLKSTITYDNLLLAVDLTNPDLRALGLDAETVHLFRGRALRDGVMHERLRITNHGMTPVAFPLTFRFGADFADLFEVRGAERPRRGRRLTPDLRDDGVTLAYRGLDDVVRRTIITATPKPARITAAELRFEVALAPKQELAIELQIRCEGEVPRVPAPRDVRFGDAYRALAEERAAERDRGARITSDNPLFNRWLERSAADLSMMLTATPWGPYPYAGIPWYNTVFGRDGLITALSTLAFDPDVALGVLGCLSATQADSIDLARDAEPGKIVHEMRRGEMAALREVPFQRYYGTVDATPLYVMLAGATLERTGDVASLARFWPSIERALAWIEGDGDHDRDGFLEYGGRTVNGLANQGWKDSCDSISHADGALARGAIALCEAQGYAFAARNAGAALARAFGHHDRAAALTQAAEDLRRRFEERFWVESLGTYALALDGDKRPCAVRSSNPGHCLWTGIVDPLRAARVGAGLLHETMFSGWGVRTLADCEVRYNPMSYHNGSVWPHDSAIVAAGLARYGMKREALAILAALFDASVFMDLNRLPELVCGFSRKDAQGPVLYPVACSPQAWSSAAVFLVLEACLGLAIDGAARQVRLTSPRLPPWLGWLELRDLVCGAGRIDLRLVRTDDDGRVEVRVIGGTGDVTLAI